MKNQQFWAVCPQILTILLTAILFLAASGCKAPANQNLPTPEVTFESTDLLPPTPTAAAAAATPEPNRVVLLAPEIADPQSVAEAQTVLSELASEEGFEFETRTELSQLELEPEIRIMAVLPPDPGLANLAAANPQVQFLGIGIKGLQPSANLSLIDAQGIRSDQQGFLAGYLAAVVTSDWRVGVIAPADTVEGKTALSAFVNGTVFFCGLCRPAFPPFVQYPITAEITSTAAESELTSAVDAMVANAVETVYIAPYTSADFIANTLAQTGANLIGGMNPPPGLESQWIASILPDQSSAIMQVWPALVEGQGGQQVDAPIVLKNVNPTLLSPGRQRLVEKTLSELLAGFISTGVDPQTGEPAN